MLFLAVTYQHVSLNIKNGAQNIKGRVISFIYCNQPEAKMGRGSQSLKISSQNPPPYNIPRKRNSALHIIDHRSRAKLPPSKRHVIPPSTIIKMKTTPPRH
jgi:hypothetical protein